MIKSEAMSRMTNLVSVTKKRSITLPSGVVDTFTLCIVSSSSQRTSVTSIMKKVLITVLNKIYGSYSGKKYIYIWLHTIHFLLKY